MKKNDLILAGIILAVAVCLLALQMSGDRDNAHLVKIRSGGKVFGTYDLSRDRTIDINGTNRLVIEDGQAWMEWADCPDQVCVRHRAVSKTGESIICLPNRVVISVEGPEESGLDGMTY